MSSAPVRPRPIRWAIAILVTIAMLVAATGVVVFAQTATSGGPTFAPASSVAWAELRLDLPGDQEEQFAELLGHLPGFADPASLDTKINELLDQVVSEASDGAASWTEDIDPWSNRQFGIALLEVPAAAHVGPDAHEVDSDESEGDSDEHEVDDDNAPALVVGLGVKDRAALEARLATLLTEEPTSTEQYAGATVITVDDDASFAVTDQYLLVAPHAADVKASLDVLAGTAPSLAESDAFAAAAQHVPANRLAAFYFSLSALRPLIETQLAGQPGAQVALDLLDQLPAWTSGYAQAAGDHLAVQVDVQLPPNLPVPAMGETDLATRFPSGTLVYLETRDLGHMFHAAVQAVLAQVPQEDAQGLDQLEQLLGVPVEQLLDPVGDAALGFGFEDGQVRFGIAATLNDPIAAQTRVTSLLALARLMAVQAKATVSTSQVEGTTVTTIAFPDTNITVGQPLSVSVALADDRLYLGVGDFVATALTQDASASLASDERFSSAVAAGGTPNSGFAFVDLAGAEGLVESMGNVDAQYRTNVKPWLDTLDYLVVSAATDEDALSTKALLFVR